MPENQNFFIIQHGVRLSGMPAWNTILSEQQIWQVTTFLSHMDKLPAQVSDEWKTAAATLRARTPTHPITGIHGQEGHEHAHALIGRVAHASPGLA